MDFAHELTRWYDLHKRDLPWRKTKDPYFVWLSEVILQQTRVAQGMSYYHHFTERYPTVFQLASASDDDVMKSWQGLGYYSRARNLLRTARAIADANGVFPGNSNDLSKLPGIGPYTASAILSFAHGKDIAVIDVNIRRIYSRMNGCSHPDDMSTKTVTDFAEKIFPRGNSSEWHQAMMDIGAQFCKANAVYCALCPLQDVCASAFKVMMKKNNTKKREPSHRDIPNRIWRGKTIEFLRHSNNYTSDVATVLHELIGNTIDDSDLVWFTKIIVPALQKDRLINHDVQTDVISLAHE